MRRAFSNPADKGSRLLSLVLLAGTLVLGVGPAAAQTVTIAGCRRRGCISASVRPDSIYVLLFEAGGPNTVVTGFSATPGDAHITLAWGDPMDSGITHFEYRVALNTYPTGHNHIPDGDGPDTNPGNETGYTITGLNNGENYSVQLRAANANGGAWTKLIWVMPLAAGVPAAPSGAVQVVSGPDSGHRHDHGHGDSPPGLTTWDHPQDPSITGYQHLTDDGWEDIPGTDATTTGVNDTVDSLRAVNANGWGRSVSPTIVVSPAPAQPTGWQAAPANGRVALTWDDPGKGVYIEFYRYTTGGGETWTQIEGSQSTVQGQFTRSTVPGLTNGQAYTFGIQAENDSGTSPPSASVTATAAVG